MAPRPALVAIGHATSGSLGTAISTAALAPLDLVTTRLKTQRLRSSSSSSSSSRQYDGIVDAFRQIAKNEGGVSALYGGLGPDVVKSVVDSFLFFGFYNYLLRRQRRRRSSSSSSSRRPGVLNELATGALAGACAKAFTTPLSNVVTRKQMSPGGDNDNDKSLPKLFSNIVKEGGVLGLWSGYSAALVLALNPGITFFVNRRLAARVIPALEEEDVPVAWVAFLLAATSKAAAVALTYPFQAAKTRLQVPSEAPRGGESTGQETDLESQQRRGRQGRRGRRWAKSLASWFLKLFNMTIFGLVYRIIKQEGVRALYDGLQGELLKNFFSHGLTMLTKGLIHRWVIRLWYLALPRLRRSTRLVAK